MNHVLWCWSVGISGDVPRWSVIDYFSLPFLKGASTILTSVAWNVYEPIPLNIENEMTLVKFSISSYFAQITSMVSCFRKYHSKVLKRFSFLEIEKSSKIAILGVSRRRKWPKLCIFFSLVQVNAMLSINLLWIVDSACLAVSKALIWFAQAPSVIIF